MAKKSNKTSHVLSLLTSRGAELENSNNEEEDLDIILNSSEASRTQVVPSTQVEVPRTQVEIPIPQANVLKSTVGLATKTQDNSSQSSNDCSDELSEIIKAQLEAIAEKEETPAIISGFNLEYFDEEEKVMYQYVNIVEDIVKMKVLETAEEMEMCTCNKCLSDIIAHTLNSLPPKYVVTEAGNLYSKLTAYENQNSTDVTSAIVQACLVIKINPRH